VQEEPKRQYSLVQRELTANAGSLAGPEWLVGMRTGGAFYLLFPSPHPTDNTSL
jgi:hypothetical protein